MIEPADHLLHDLDDRRVGVPEDRTHLAAREVEHRAARRVIDIRTGSSVGDERDEVPGAAVSDQMAGSAGEVRAVGSTEVTHDDKLPAQPGIVLAIWTCRTLRRGGSKTTSAAHDQSMRSPVRPRSGISTGDSGS